MRWQDAKPLMGQYHRFGDSVMWRIVRSSYRIYGGVEETRLNGITTTHFQDTSVTVAAAATYLTELNEASTTYDVPYELILTAMLCSQAYNLAVWTPDFILTIDGYLDDVTTPDKIFVGLAGVCLSQAQMIIDPNLTVVALQDVQTNLNACAAIMSYQSDRTKFDPIFVGAHYNQNDIRYDADSSDRFRMLVVRDVGDEPGRWLDQWFSYMTGAIASYPVIAGVTGPSYGDLLFYWIEAPPQPDFHDLATYTYDAARDAITNGLTISSTISPQLNGTWPLSFDIFRVMCAAALLAYNEQGPDVITFPNDTGPVDMNRVEMCRVYAALANFCEAIVGWDGNKAFYPDDDTPLPSTTTTIP